MKRRVFLFFASVVFLVYVLAPVAWMASSSFQGEAEITSRPPHWIPHEPTLENFEAIFQAQREQQQPAAPQQDVQIITPTISH